MLQHLQSDAKRKSERRGKLCLNSRSPISPTRSLWDWSPREDLEIFNPEFAQRTKLALNLHIHLLRDVHMDSKEPGKQYSNLQDRGQLPKGPADYSTITFLQHPNSCTEHHCKPNSITILALSNIPPGYCAPKLKLKFLDDPELLRGPQSSCHFAGTNHLWT